MPTSDANSSAVSPLARQRSTRFVQTSRDSLAMPQSSTPSASRRQRRWSSNAYTTVAVGTALVREDSGRPPHRSQRAGLPHWALALGSDLEALIRPGMDGADGGKPAGNDTVHSPPIEATALAPPPKRSVPAPRHCAPE